MIDISSTIEWSAAHPGAIIGLLEIAGVENTLSSPQLTQRKRQIEAHLRKDYAGFSRQDFLTLPVMAAYQKYYRRFDKTYHVLLQVESIVLKAKNLPDVSPLVDANFAAEVNTFVATAGHDVAKLEQLISLTNVRFAQNLEHLEKDIKIFFDDSAARYVLENPEKALNIEMDSIWHSFEGYRITLVWHEKSSVPVTWKVWERGLNKFLYQDTSLIKKSLTLADSLKFKVNREQNKIAQHISSYLNEETKFDAFIYCVAFTYP